MISHPQYDFAFAPECIVDNFAGGGGASLGIEWAFGRAVDHAINHDREALAMHAANHPDTVHHCESVWDIDPRKLCPGPVGLAWFSPDCKHFSKAKGGKPVEKRIRGLAWVAVRWAATVKPRVICLENVEEFQQWGPLVQVDGKWMPDPKRKGATFNSFCNALRRHGYTVQHRELRACDYGTPTIRKRLFLIARCDGNPIVWPAPTHGKGRLPYRTAADCIDWSIPCPSIFERKRPLAEATLRRIAKGIQRYVIDSADPFIVPITHVGGDRVHSIHDPMRTVTSAHRGEFAVVAPYMVPRYGERDGQEPRTMPADAPMATIVPTGNGARLVSAFLAQHNSSKPGASAKAGRSATDPLSTIVHRGTQQNLVTAYLAQHNGGANGHQTVGHDARVPVSTINAKGSQQQVVTAAFVKRDFGTSTGAAVDTPLPTVTADGGGHASLVRAFLIKYYGNERDGVSVREPMHTVPTKDRMGLVTVHGTEYEIVDIGMRMLTPRELARAQGFPDSYILDPIVNGKPLTKTSQIRMIGNSVCPPLARAVVEANVGAARKLRAAA